MLIKSRGLCACDVVLLSPARNSQKKHVSARFLSKSARHFVTGHVRHSDVENGCIGRVPQEPFECFFSAVRHHGLVAGDFEEQAQRVCRVLIVVRDQDFEGSAVVYRVCTRSCGWLQCPRDLHRARQADGELACYAGTSAGHQISAAGKGYRIRSALCECSSPPPLATVHCCVSTNSNSPGDDIAPDNSHWLFAGGMEEHCMVE